MSASRTFDSFLEYFSFPNPSAATTSLRYARL